MLVMGMHRIDRVHLSKRIDLMGKVTAIGFVAPALDPHNGGANAAGEEGDDINNGAVVGICAARTAESKGDGVGVAPLLEPRVTVTVEGEDGVKGNGVPQKRARTHN
jgi:hypothetical protein